MKRVRYQIRETGAILEFSPLDMVPGLSSGWFIYRVRKDPDDEIVQSLEVNEVASLFRSDFSIEVLDYGQI